MLVRYRMNSTANVTTMRTDIDNIIRGLANTTAHLSVGCDTANTVFYGTYPSAKYAQVGTAAGSDTYSKIHNDYGDQTDYIRLSYDATKLTTITLANSYTSGTDTLVNSREVVKYESIGYIQAKFSGAIMTVNAVGNLKLGYTLAPGDIIGPNYDRYYSTGTAGANFSGAMGLMFPKAGEYALGNSGANSYDPNSVSPSTTISSQVTGTTGSTGTYSMSTSNEMNQVFGFTYWQVFRPVSANILPNTFSAYGLQQGIDIIVSSKMLVISSPYNATSIGIFDIGKNGVSRIYTSDALMAGIDLESEYFGGIIPYRYKFTTNSYGSQAAMSLVSTPPLRKFNENGSVVVIENPVFINHEDNGNVLSVIYGLYKIPENVYGAHTTYVDGSSVRRFTINDYSLLTE
jgi:hypothetical protein